MNKLEEIFENKGFIHKMLIIEKKANEKIISKYTKKIKSINSDDYAKGLYNGFLLGAKTRNRSIKTDIKIEMGVI